MIKSSFSPVAPQINSETRLTVPTTYCPVYMRIQPCVAPIPFLHQSPSDPSSPSTVLFFLLLLRDPTHNLSHSTISQSMPTAWLDIPFEENEWVEDIMVEVIRGGVEIIGQECRWSFFWHLWTLLTRSMTITDINHRMKAQVSSNLLLAELPRSNILSLTVHCYK
jgi:hypothetical protein